SVLALTKTGTAQQTLSGSVNNAFTGGVTVLAGILRLNKTAGQNSIPAGSLIIGDGTASAVLQWAAGNQIPDSVVPMLAGTGATAGIMRMFGRVETLGGLSSNPIIGGGIVENELGSAGTATLTLSLAANTSQTFTGIIRDGDSAGIDGSLILVKTGAGIQVLAGDNTFSGGTTISAGTLVIGNGGATGSLGSGSIVNNGTLVISHTGALGFGQAITGTGSLVLGGSQTLTLSGNANTYSGDTIVDQGTLLVANTSGSATGTGAVLVASPATMAGTGIIGGAVTINGGGTLAVGNISGDSTGKTLQINGLFGSLGALSFDLWADNNGINPQVNADVLRFGGPDTGMMSIGGTLNVNGNSINNWQAGDQWQLFDWGSIAPADRNVAFTALNLPALPGGLTFDVSALGSSGMLSIISVAPEPARAVLLLLGVAAGLMRRRRGDRGV
ncbi:MAG: hypothetical protein JWO94_269, partial [Verrucomicrobiaceae bacterium]|nr:hypothetical protein [Verrucomicrobiaceae bacterium]